MRLLVWEAQEKYPNRGEIRVPQDMYDELIAMLPKAEQGMIRERGLHIFTFMGYQITPYKAGYLNVP
jgi:hypothetical protein